MSGFGITRHSGFHITFSNGYTLSVQFSPTSHCEHYNKLDFTKGTDTIEQMNEPKTSDIWRSEDAEIAVFSPTKELINLREIGLKDDDTVKGYVSSEQVADYIQLVRNLPLKQVDIV